MKKTKLLVALAAIAFAGIASAANDKSDVGVSATVLGNCKFTANSPVDFGTLDPASSSTVTASGSVTFWCTKGTSYTLSANNGAHASGTQKRMKGPGASDFVDYSLSLASTTGTGAGKSSPITVSASGSVDPAAFQDAAEGAYADTVSVNVTP